MSYEGYKAVHKVLETYRRIEQEQETLTKVINQIAAHENENLFLMGPALSTKDGFAIQASIVIRVLKTRMRELQETEKELDEVLGQMETVLVVEEANDPLDKEQLPEVPPDDGPINTQNAHYSKIAEEIQDATNEKLRDIWE